MENDLERLIREAAGELGIRLDDRQLSQFARYHEELLLWNNKINLVSVQSPLDIPVKHFIDSLTVLPFIGNREGRVLDIGSGGGFPALPLKIAVPGMDLTLVESARKKASFLKHCIRTLELVNIAVIAARTEELVQSGDYAGGFDTVISRATFKLPDFLLAGAPFLRPGGILLAMKGSPLAEEIGEAAGILQPAGLTFVSRHELRLPVTGDPRTIFLYKKAA